MDAVVAEAPSPPDQVIDGALELGDSILELREARIGILGFGHGSKLGKAGGVATGGARQARSDGGGQDPVAPPSLLLRYCRDTVVVLAAYCLLPPFASRWSELVTGEPALPP